MGEAARRKKLGLSREPNIQDNLSREPDIQGKLTRERELYKKCKLTKLKPDLGMALIPEYPHAFKIGCSGDIQTHPDSIFGTGILGILSSYGSIKDNQLPKLPLLMSEGYCFTIALGKGKTRKEIDSIINLLQKTELIVAAAPQYKYLTRGTNEWVLPLVPIDLAEDSIELISE